MLVLLPPSETKRDGGAAGTRLDLALLSHPELGKQRRATLAALRTLSSNLNTMSAALGLGPTQKFEALRNREVRSSPVLPAIDRYTGVLYDALDAGTLPAEAREFAGHIVRIQSALFGLVGALDPIPAYRLSHDSRLPALPLKKTWAAAVSAVIPEDELVLDLRSEAYVHLGPVPASGRSYFLRLVSEDASGTTRALNHFNKHGKGVFVRQLLEAGLDHPDVESLLAWAAACDIPLTLRGDGLVLVVH